MNKERIAELASFLDNLDDGHFQMNTFFTQHPDSPSWEHPHYFDPWEVAGKAEELKHACGTAGCIAGWAVALFGDPSKVMHSDIESTAAALLNLTGGEATYLFYGHWTPSYMETSRQEAIAFLRECAARGSIFTSSDEEDTMKTVDEAFS